MFNIKPTNPKTNRPCYGPDWACWDVDETTNAGVVFRELGAMSGLPVDLELARRGIHRAELHYRGQVWFRDASLTHEEHDCLPDLGVRLVIPDIEPVLLSESELLGAKLTPGSVHAAFRTLSLSVERLSLRAWDGVESMR